MITKIPFPEDYEKIFSFYNKRETDFYSNFYDWIVHQIYPSHDLLYGKQWLGACSGKLQVSAIFLTEDNLIKLTKINKKKNKLRAADVYLHDLMYGPALARLPEFKQKYNIEPESGFIYIDEADLWRKE